MITIYAVLFFAATALSFYFSGTEAAFLALNKPVYSTDLSSGNKLAKKLKPYVEKPQKVLMLLLFGNNLANIACIYLATNLWLNYFGIVGQVYFIAFITVLLSCISEIAPKIIFRSFANELLYATVGILRFFDIVFAPFISWLFFLGKKNGEKKFKNTSALFLKGEKPFKVLDKENLLTHKEFSKEDFKHIIERGKQDGAFRGDQVSFMQKLSTLSVVKIMELMTPIADLLILHIDQDLMEVQDGLRSEGRHLIPVFEKRIDNIVGYVDTLDVFTSTKKTTIARDYLKKPSYEPDICTIDKIYHTFQNFHDHMVVAVNEHGGCSGIITEFDFVMNIFGMRYENSNNITSLIKKISRHRYHVDSSVDIDDLNELLGMNIKKFGFETLGGFAIYLFGGLAVRGMSRYYGEIQIKVLRATHTSIDEIAIVFPEKRKGLIRNKIGISGKKL